MSPPLNSKFTLNGKLMDESPATCDKASVQITGTHTHTQTNWHVLSIAYDAYETISMWKALDVPWHIAVMWMPHPQRSISFTRNTNTRIHTLHAKGSSHHIHECLRRGRLLKRIILSTRILWLRPDFIEWQTFKSFSTSTPRILLIERKDYVTTVYVLSLYLFAMFGYAYFHLQ